MHRQSRKAKAAVGSGGAGKDTTSNAERKERTLPHDCTRLSNSCQEARRRQRF